MGGLVIQTESDLRWAAAQCGNFEAQAILGHAEGIKGFLAKKNTLTDESSKKTADLANLFEKYFPNKNFQRSPANQVAKQNLCTTTESFFKKDVEAFRPESPAPSSDYVSAVLLKSPVFIGKNFEAKDFSRNPDSLFCRFVNSRYAFALGAIVIIPELGQAVSGKPTLNERSPTSTHPLSNEE